MRCLYNEIDPFAAEWLRNLINAGELPPGRVDERSIAELTGADLEGIDELHLFAGVGGWPLALRLAGWIGPVWTGSCPCQPFSSAGKRRGTEDERHLWPEMFRLIRECRPATIFGEQVAGKAALEWLDGVSADLEGEGYAVGSVVLGAHSVGAPHIRQRLFWVAESKRRAAERHGHEVDGTTGGVPSSPRQQRIRADAGDGRTTRGLGDSDGLGEGEIGSVQAEHGADRAGSVDRLEHSAGDGRHEGRAGSDGRGVTGGCGLDGLGDANNARPQGRRLDNGGRADELSPWAASVVIPCRDGKHRRISSQPGDEPLAASVPRQLGSVLARLERMGHSSADSKGLIRNARRNRVGRLRGYGNAIIPTLAAEFIRAFMETAGR